jgi:hypothetical protein
VETFYAANFNFAGLTYSISYARDSKGNFRWYHSGAASLGYPMFPLIGGNFSIDFYENTSDMPVLDEIAGLTFDSSVGTGKWGVTYSRPIGYGTGIGIGLDRTRYW